MARIHLLRLTGQRKCPSFRNPLKALLTQPCGFTFLAYWLSSPEKMFSPAGSILHKLFSPPYFSQPPEAVSVGRGLQRDKAKVAGGDPGFSQHMQRNTFTSIPGSMYATLDQGELGQQQPWLLPIFAAGHAPAAKPPCSGQGCRRAGQRWQHELAISQLPKWPSYIRNQKSVEDRRRKKSPSLREHFGFLEIIPCEGWPVLRSPRRQKGGTKTDSFWKHVPHYLVLLAFSGAP